MRQHNSKRAARQTQQHSAQSSLEQQPYKSLTLSLNLSPPITKFLLLSNLNSSKRGVSSLLFFNYSVV